MHRTAFESLGVVGVLGALGVLSELATMTTRPAPCAARGAET